MVIVGIFIAGTVIYEVANVFLSTPATHKKETTEPLFWPGKLFRTMTDNRPGQVISFSRWDALIGEYAYLVRVGTETLTMYEFEMIPVTKEAVDAQVNRTLIK